MALTALWVLGLAVGFQWPHGSLKREPFAPAGEASLPPVANGSGSEASLLTGSEFGEPLPGIAAAEFELFRLGLDDFLEVEEAEEGLGPVFNGRSCAECHAVPRVGGSGSVMEVRAGILTAEGLFVEPAGGSLFQLFSIPTHQSQALIPPTVNVIAHRKPLPLFGAGLVEAVPDRFLESLQDPEDLDGDGVRGRVHWVVDRASGKLRAGRFGWKAQQATLLVFGAEAYRDEMGITSDLFPEEACPGGDCESISLVDLVPDPEDAPDPLTGLRGIDNFANFMLLLGPPPRRALSPEAQEGELLFQQIGCAKCHVPFLRTGTHAVKALSNRTFAPYGDFLLHDIGTGDGIQQGDARPGEIRTAPLWGVRFRAPFLHDGRAATLDEAIRLHGGEASHARKLYTGLSEESRQAILRFLESI